MGNVAKQRRNGALEITGSEDCTLPIDFEYGQGAPGTVLEFTERAAIYVRATKRSSMDMQCARVGQVSTAAGHVNSAISCV